MPSEEELISISDFSRLSGIKRKNLIFYDECDLLRPDRVGANGYRYYTASQLGTVSIILAFREMGFPLKEIKDILRNRYPERILSLFAEQELKLTAEIERLKGSLRMMRAYQTRIDAGRAADEDRIELLELEPMPVFFGPDIDPEEQPGRYEAVASFYETAAPHGIATGHPVAAEIDRKCLHAGGWQPRRYYCHTPHGNGHKEAGLYVVAHGRVEEPENGLRLLHTAVTNYIRVNRLRIVGNAYEETLIGELAASEVEDRMVRLEVRVEKI